MVSWLTQKLNKYPSSTDVYNISIDYYNSGNYKISIALLEYYLSLPDCDVVGHHLLAYAYYMSMTTSSIDLLTSSISHLKSSVNAFDNDWQLLIELSIELNEQERNELDKDKLIKSISTHMDAIL